MNHFRKGSKAVFSFGSAFLLELLFADFPSEKIKAVGRKREASKAVSYYLLCFLCYVLCYELIRDARKFWWENAWTRYTFPCPFYLAESHTVFDRMSPRGAHLILGARGEALIRKRRSFERGAYKIFLKKRRYNNFPARINSFA